MRATARRWQTSHWPFSLASQARHRLDIDHLLTWPGQVSHACADMTTRGRDVDDPSTRAGPKLITALHRNLSDTRCTSRARTGSIWTASDQPRPDTAPLG